MVDYSRTMSEKEFFDFVSNTMLDNINTSFRRPNFVYLRKRGSIGEATKQCHVGTLENNFDAITRYYEVI